MLNTAVVYWSGTGNTEAMAKAVAEGLASAGAQVTLFTPTQFQAHMLADFHAVAFGCPSMGAEELEEDEFAPMFDSCKSGLAGKKLALFGSYGGGDGQWMRDWEDTCRSIGAHLVAEGLICNESPDEEGLEACRRLGAALV